MSEKDYFRSLGIPRGSTTEEVKRAYRELAFRYHPDTSGGGQESTERFREIREAYDVLSDSDRRIRHERNLDSKSIPVRRSSSPARAFRNGGLGTLGPFNRRQFNRGFAYGNIQFRPVLTLERFPGRQPYGPSGVYDFPLTASEARDGTERSLRIDLPHKTLRITIESPPGVEQGALLEVVGPRTRRLGIQIFLRARILD